MEDVPPWIGCDRLLKYYDQCPSELHRKIFATLFETGGRVSEVVELKREDFDWNDQAVNVTGMLVKKYRKHKRRDFLIKRDEKEPLVEDLISFVEGCETEYLFPKHAPLTGEVIPEEHASTTQIYLLVRQISKDLWPHWFRSQRASFLVYVRNFDIYKLVEWFNWKSIETPLHYVRQTQKEQAEALGITEIPGRQKISKTQETASKPKTSMSDEEYKRLKREVLGHE